MQITQEELNALAERCHKTNGLLLRLMALNGEGADLAFQAQQRLNGVFQALLRLGADDPRYQHEPESCRPTETPLHLLSSPANLRYLEALRAAVEAAKDVDRERGCLGDGPSELLEDWLFGLEFEVKGPVALRGE